MDIVIIAWRIPQLTAQMNAATLAAMDEAKAGAPSAGSGDAAIEYDLVERLERLGYRVTLEPLAA
jgi:hypothetical protein